MNSVFKQRGVGLVEFILTLVLSLIVFIAALPFYNDYQTDKKAKAYGEHIRGLIERIHQYQYYKITEEDVDSTSKASWPATLDNLMNDYPEQYWGSCTIDQELNGECKLPDYVPWSPSRLSTYFYTDLTHIPAFNEHLVIRIPLSELASDPKEWTRYSNVLIDIPGAKRSGHDIHITLRQATLALMYENIVMRDGSVTLTEDWDIGGEHGITNAKDYLIAASDGSQISVSKRLVTIEGVSHGETVRKPACSEGLSPNLILSIGEIKLSTEHAELSEFKAYIKSQNDNYWTVAIDTTAKNKNTKSFEITHFGKATALVQCF
ncbi:hypothetical protein AB4425_17315 [Vibrio sp. 10N.261.51.A1]|uniref:hypothetical protein n=1 Tax=unclassified Vibrio TaxID=2614977 RepID=UPI00354B12E4